MNSVFIQKISHNYEVLVGDDASDDGTQEILEEYKKKYPDKIKLFLREKNIGATENCYELYMSAQGKYIAHLDGDDYWTDCRKLQKQIDFLESNPSFIGTCHKFSTVNSDGNPVKKKLRWVKHKTVFSLKDFQGIYLPSQPSTFVRKNIYLDKTRDFSFLYKIDRCTSDITALLFFLSRGNFYCFDETMSAYRLSTSHSDSSVSQTRYRKNKQAIEQDLIMISNYERFVREEFDGSVDMTLRRKELYTSAVIRCFKEKNFNGLSVLKKIRNGRSRILFFAYLPVGIVSRLIEKFGAN